mmetsp:Transcript_31884/g.98658  ORF Transcript_31884/g.98658 Transcript_31884/m.98658 type:complete len:384 (-) Transcript_31884:310-1461(-)
MHAVPDRPAVDDGGAGRVRVQVGAVGARAVGSRGVEVEVGAGEAIVAEAQIEREVRPVDVHRKLRVLALAVPNDEGMHAAKFERRRGGRVTIVILRLAVEDRDGVGMGAGEGLQHVFDHGVEPRSEPFEVLDDEPSPVHAVRPAEAIGGHLGRHAVGFSAQRGDCGVGERPHGVHAVANFAGIQLRRGHPGSERVRGLIRGVERRIGGEQLAGHGLPLGGFGMRQTLGTAPEAVGVACLTLGVVAVRSRRGEPREHGRRLLLEAHEPRELARGVAVVVADGGEGPKGVVWDSAGKRTKARDAALLDDDVQYRLPAAHVEGHRPDAAHGVDRAATRRREEGGQFVRRRDGEEKRGEHVLQSEPRRRQHGVGVPRFARGVGPETE